MLRVKDLDRALDFYVNKLGLVELKRYDNEQGKFTLVFLATAPGEPEIELTYNWGMEEEYTFGRNFGHLAFEVENIYQTCQRLIDNGVTINRPPRDGRMAFIKSPDNQSIEFLQKGNALAPQSPWTEMENIGAW
jgi:lactoylglutathione lyase